MDSLQDYRQPQARIHLILRGHRIPLLRPAPEAPEPEEPFLLHERLPHAVVVTVIDGEASLLPTAIAVHGEASLLPAIAVAVAALRSIDPERASKIPVQ